MDSLTCLKRSISSAITVGRKGTVAGREAERGLDPVEEELTVRQPGQVVVNGIVQQALLRGLGIRHVRHRADDADDLAVGATTGRALRRYQWYGPETARSRSRGRGVRAGSR
jgi:hypothetical protein